MTSNKPTEDKEFNITKTQQAAICDLKGLHLCGDHLNSKVMCNLSSTLETNQNKIHLAGSKRDLTNKTENIETTNSILITGNNCRQYMYLYIHTQKPIIKSISDWSKTELQNEIEKEENNSCRTPLAMTTPVTTGTRVT